MYRSITRSMCVIALLFVSSLTIAQTEFSADVVNNSRAGSPVEMKLYFGKDKMRFEAAEQQREGQGAGIVNLATQTTTVLLPQQRMYMELPAQTAEQRLMFNFFRTGDVENACGDWLKIVRNQGGTCHKVGHERVNGRDTVKYEGTNSKGDSGYFWIDPQLRFPVKWADNKGPNSGGELRNIKEGSQPASLFEIPAGYTKFDMGSMMQR
jgi:hypothetical protein